MHVHDALVTEITDDVKARQKEAEKNGVLGHGMHQPFESMFDDVFEHVPPHLVEQREQMIAEQKRKFGPDWEPR